MSIAKKRLLVLCITGLLLIAAVPALAQSNDWYVYLYNGQSGTLARIYADGTQEDFSLGLPENVYVGSMDMVFSTDGQQVAFCQVSYEDTGDGNYAGIATLILRDLASESNLIEVSLGLSIGCRASAFNPDESRIAVGNVRHFPGDPMADTSEPAWQLLLVDVAGGTVSNELTEENNAALAQLDLMEHLAIMPDVRHFDSDSLTVASFPWGVGGGYSIPAFHWEPDSNSVEVVPYWGNINQDYLPATDELAWAEYDPNLPAGEPGGPMESFNVLRLRDAGGSASTIYHNPDWIIVDVNFVNSGQQIAVLLLESFNMEDIQPQSYRWILIDRSGNATVVGESNAFTQLVAVPEGFVIMWSEYTGGDYEPPIAYNIEYHSGDTTTPVWSFESPDYGITWELVWGTPGVINAGELSGFAAIDN